MKSKFDVNILELRSISGKFNDFIETLSAYKDQIQKVEKYLNRPGLEEFIVRLRKVEEEQGKHVSDMVIYKKSLVDIADFYQKTEQKLMGESGEKDSEVTTKEDEKEQTWYEKFFEGLGDSIKQDLLSSMLESGGNTLVRLAGAINAWTALASSPGEHGFIIVDPDVIGTTSKMAKLGTCFSKYGVPIIGGIIDLAGQISSGEGTGHAVTKAAIHTAVGIGVGVAVNAATGAALGAAFGSVVPVAGTVVGAVVGFAAGCVITFVANEGIDYVYDNYLKEPINTACEAIKDTACKVVSKIGEGIDNVGDAVSGFFGGIGSTIFG